VSGFSGLSDLLTPLAVSWPRLPSDPSSNMSGSLILGGIAFFVTLLTGGVFIDQLRHRNLGKEIRIDGPQTHYSKRGTPTMGGVMVVALLVAMSLIFDVAGRNSVLLPISVAVLGAIIGAVDDFQSLVGRSKGGMSARKKFALLFLVAIGAALVLHLPEPYGFGLRHMYVPWLGRYDIGILYLPAAILFIAGMGHAVNLTDGLDTQAPGLLAIAFVAYGIIAYQQGQIGVVTFCFIAVGSLLGFLWYNAHPAQVFMGDAGALGLGAALATCAFMTGQWLLLPIVGSVFIAEAASVSIQVYFFKRSGGKRRVFKMTPLHHHFELSGWKETQIAMRFWIVGMVSGLLGVALALS
jgi:phospho-N-acetylmuramoyl-pentapeptide-transferase